jgi:hypothetical protein
MTRSLGVSASITIASISTLLAPAKADLPGRQLSLVESLSQARGDLDHNGVVDGADIGLLLLKWGQGAGSPADLDGNGLVDGGDLGLLLLNWGPLNIVDAEGWLVLPALLQPDSRIVFVSADGDDGTAADNEHGRSHYLPHDPEIGADPTGPIGPILAYRTIAAAKVAVRDGSDTSLAGEPEWLLLRRGDTFEIGSTRFIDRRTAGRSNTARRVFGAYGDIALPRPIVQGTPPEFIRSWDGGGNYVVASIEFGYPPGTIFAGRPPSQSISMLYGADNVLLEDLRFPQTTTMVVQESEGRSPTRFEMRRCAVSGNWNSGSISHVQGIFASIDGAIWIEECVFDLNGYKEDPLDPSSWTAGLVSSGTAGALPGGTGVQPTRTWFDRNMYLSRYSSLHLRGNIISRGGGGGSVQMRVGGVAERNALLFNHEAISTGHPQADRSMLQDAILRSNLVLHDDHMLPPGAFGLGIGLGVGDQDLGTTADNVVGHFHRLGNGSFLFYATGIPASGDRPPESALSVTLVGNVGVDRFNSGIALASTTSASGIQSAFIGGNAIVRLSGGAAAAGDAAAAPTVEFGTSASGGNDYFAPTWDFEAWQASGYDPESTRHSSIEALATAKAWIATPDATGRRGWERDIVSYMQSIDSTFVSDEDITVEYGVPADRRRPEAPAVWVVLSDPAYYPNSGPFWSARVLSEPDARLAARRYHAFLTFIERAKANRRGAWDPAYTADALNDYIREGFGKPPVSSAGRSGRSR